MSAGAQPLERSLALAYAFMGRRERTEAEVRARLERAGAEAAVVQASIETLREQGNLDDCRYARLFVEDKRSLEGWGAERIRRSLAEHGIERELIEQALREEGDPDSELCRALELLRRRFPQPPRGRRERDRALGVMLRKGYEPELALDALGAYSRGAADGEPG